MGQRTRLKEIICEIDEKLLIPLSLQSREMLLSKNLAKPTNVFYSWQHEYTQPPNEQFLSKLIKVKVWFYFFFIHWIFFLLTSTLLCLLGPLSHSQPLYAILSHKPCCYELSSIILAYHTGQTNLVALLSVKTEHISRKTIL